MLDRNDGAIETGCDMLPRNTGLSGGPNQTFVPSGNGISCIPDIYGCSSLVTVPSIGLVPTSAGLCLG